MSPTITPTTCLHCGAPTKTRRTKYCSRTCYAQSKIGQPLSQAHCHAVREAHRRNGYHATHLQHPETSAKRKASCAASQKTKRHLEKLVAHAQTLPRNQPGTQHHQSRHWYLRDPKNRHHTVLNLRHFIRQNAHLFEPQDLSSRAYNGLAQLRPSTTKRPTLPSWKGWTWAALTEANAKGVAAPACTLKNDPTASTESPRPAC